MNETSIRDRIHTGKLHVTLLYAPDSNIEYTPSPEEVHRCSVIGVDIIGEGKWRALVLKLESASLHEKFQSIIDTYGKIHSYPSLTLHVSVKYNPGEFDLGKLRSRDLVGKNLWFRDEYVKHIN